MKQQMISLVLTDDQVLRSVVGAVAVDMMDDRSVRHVVSEGLLGDNDVLVNVTVPVFAWMWTID